MSRTIGSILIVAGTAIGAGMLATPMTTAAAGFPVSALLMVILWGIMCVSALLTAEAALAFPAGYNGFNTMAHATLGRSGQVICWLSFLGLLYALNSAYISGGGSILSTTLQTFFNIDMPQWANKMIFLVVFGMIIFSGARSVDMVNRVLISIKGVIFIITLSLITPYVDLQKLMNPEGEAKFLLAAIPILITSFGFHVVIPSLTTYTQNNVQAIVRAIVIGSFLPLVIYIIWLAGILGVVPLVGELSFISVLKEALYQHKDDVGVLLNTIDILVENRWLSASVNFFSHLAIITSFLGVGLALFDYLLDMRKNRSTSTRVQTILLAFIPPLLFAMYYPQGFRLALGFAGIFVAITCIILPALFAWKVRTNPSLSSPYRVKGGMPVIIFVILAGIVVIVLEVMDKLGFLPNLTDKLF